MIYCDDGGWVDAHRLSVRVREGTAMLRDGGEHVRLHRVKPRGPEEPRCVGSSWVETCVRSRPRCSAIQHRRACATVPRRAGCDQREPGQIGGCLKARYGWGRRVRLCCVESGGIGRGRNASVEPAVNEQRAARAWERGRGVRERTEVLKKAARAWLCC